MKFLNSWLAAGALAFIVSLTGWAQTKAGLATDELLMQLPASDIVAVLDIK
ncbi:MAG: hypothetical protein HOP19_22260, partial [Acidobacteria bacterium]|nr:hypothetical protein [Acidobacteriota bacterium]